MKTLLLTTLFSLSANASVNMKDASFMQSWTDMPGLTRVYNSRSLHNGLFGFGWCSEFEKSLNLNEPGKITLHDCQNGDSDPGPALKKIHDQYILVSAGEEITFNSRGQLLRLQQKAKISQFIYDESGRLRKVLINKKNILHLNYDPGSGKVKEVFNNKKQYSRYTYAGQDLLSVKNIWDSVYSFRYDGLHNLTRVLYPDLTQERLTYDADKDWVLSFRDRKRCLESYTYTQEFDHMISSLSRSCGLGPKTEARFEFWHKINLQGLNYLDKVKITQGSRTTEITYDALSGESRWVSHQQPLRLAAGKEDL